MPANDLALGLDAGSPGQEHRIEPDPWQADVLRSTAPRRRLNCSQ